MNKITSLIINDKTIREFRGPKKPPDPFKPYDYFVEKERTAVGTADDTGTIFLTNNECPYTCLMCDLWQYTTDSPVPRGAIPRQIELALENMPDVRHIKLYNGGSFFDPKAILPSDWKAIASLLRGFKTVTVENHPLLTGKKCIEFRDLLKTDLEIAMGLEDSDPAMLKLLNKKMNPEDFCSSVEFLKKNNILTRAFILLRPPFLSEEEGLDHARRSAVFAFDAGTDCCTLIPVRGGNGIMEHLKKDGYFTPPSLASVETIQEYGISLGKGRFFADNWDLELLSDCPDCFSERKKRIEDLNLSQRVVPKINCHCRES